MEAKDTEIWCDDNVNCKPLCHRVQAEISFPLGKQMGFETGIEQGKAEGRREVVEWINQFKREAPYAGKQLGQFIFEIERPDWRAQLKIWFKDNPEVLKTWDVK